MEEARFVEGWRTRQEREREHSIAHRRHRASVLAARPVVKKSAKEAKRR